MAAPAGALAFVQCGDDRRVETHGRGVVAHAGRRTDRWRVACSHDIHEASARPPHGGIKAGLVRVRAGLAEARKGSVDQPLVERCDVIVCEAELPTHLRWEVYDEHVRVGCKLVENIE